MFEAKNGSKRLENLTRNLTGNFDWNLTKKVKTSPFFAWKWSKNTPNGSNTAPGYLIKLLQPICLPFSDIDSLLIEIISSVIEIFLPGIFCWNQNNSDARSPRDSWGAGQF